MPTGYQIVLAAVFILSPIVAGMLFFISAPYGRYARPKWGFMIPRRWAWVIMETPAVVVPLYYFVVSDRRAQLVPIIFFMLWQAHYFWRSYIFPFRLRVKKGAGDPITIILFAFIFTSSNGYLQGRWLFHLGPELGVEWLYDPRFIIGLLLFVGGYFINHQSDEILRNLRKPGETGYKVPHGGAYRWVTCPNYLGELIEWIGWAILTWSWAGVAFAVWTAANLLPRALEHHKWYHETFDDYPKERKALIPYLL